MARLVLKYRGLIRARMKAALKYVDEILVWDQKNPVPRSVFTGDSNTAALLVTLTLTQQLAAKIPPR
jgi:hypothetical protein